MTEKQSPAASQFEDREDDAKYNAPRYEASAFMCCQTTIWHLCHVASRVAMTLADFELVQRLGDGSFSQVVLGRHRHTHKQYAIKIIDKHLILRHKQTKYIQNERYLLDKINSDSVSDLYFTFQDEHSLYLGLEYCPNGTDLHQDCSQIRSALHRPYLHICVLPGELYDQIHRRKKLEVQDVQFYAAEMVLMLRLLQQEQASLACCR